MLERLSRACELLYPERNCNKVPVHGSDLGRMHRMIFTNIITHTVEQDIVFAGSISIFARVCIGRGGTCFGITPNVEEMYLEELPDVGPFPWAFLTYWKSPRMNQW